ncbi:MAG: membrane protein insertase YidC, partial [Alphaproteobacteria bacterium]|nr:membrane protein insertase YidC [Alphaproteobacteria bacterium]
TKVPDAQTEWTANRETLTPQNPVTLTWDNGEGLIFSREVAIDDNYMITVNQRVENTGTASVTLFPYALASRTGLPDTLGFFILHEGPIGVFNETLNEVKYDDLIDDGPIAEISTGGWIGMSDKYWLVALVPDQDTDFKAGFRHSVAGDDKFQVDYLGTGVTIAPGTIGEVTNRVFAGAKEVETLEAYRVGLGIDRFDLAVDWGWLFFLTKPIFQAIEYLFGLIGNFGVAIIVFTAFVRLLFFPLANKSFRSMGKMRMLQPEMTRLREAYKDDRERMTKETMELYKREGVNPLSGCLPILLQIPVFFALYKVLFVTIEMRHAPFYGWIKDLSAPDPTSFVNLFGLIPFDPPSFLTIGIWPLLMGLTMYLQQKLNPAPPDPIQAKVFMFLPVIFTVILAGFPAGLVIYWTANNTLTIAQQWIIMRRAAAAGPAPTPPAKT